MEELTMKTITSYSIKVLTILGFIASLSACAVITRSFEGSTETFQNTSEVSTDFTSSTSPRDEHKNSEARKVKAFASVNLERLQEDMARGSGEHLTAFAHLLGIKDAHQAEFFALAKEKYPVLFSSEPTTSEVLLARLDTELQYHPGWR
jgi:hypothetical protein